MSRWFVSAAAITLAVALAGSARAEALAAPPALELSFRSIGAEACPGRDELVTEVTARLGRDPFEEGAQRSIEIVLEQGPGGYWSKVILRDEAGQVIGRRTLASDESTCRGLFSATALSVALLIDPDAALRDDAGAEESIARFEVVPAPPAVPAPSAPEPASAPCPPPPAAPTPPAAEPESPRRASVAAEGLLGAGLLPEPVPGVGLFAAGRLGERWGFHAQALYLVSARAEQSGAAFDVGLTAFGLGASFDLVAGSGARLVLDAGPVAGALHASVTSPVPTNPGDFFFLSLSGALRAELGLGGGFLLHLRGAALVPLLRRGLFVRGEPEAVFRMPAVAALAGAGMGYVFF